MSSRSRPSAERSTSTSTTSRASRASSGPQGTLYGASSEAGTIRIITNKPELGNTYGRVDGELNTVAHGGVGGKLEGMINMPIAKRDRVPRSRFLPARCGLHRQRPRDAYLLRNSDFEPDPPTLNPATRHCRLHQGRTNRHQHRSQEKNFNEVDDVRRPSGAEDRSRRELDCRRRRFMYQKTKTNGVFFYDPESRRPEDRPLPRWSRARTASGRRR